MEKKEALRKVITALSELAEEYRVRWPEFADSLDELAILLESEAQSTWGLLRIKQGVLIEAVLFLRAYGFDARRCARYELAQELSALEEAVCGLID